MAVACNVSDAAQLKSLVDTVTAAWGKIDTLVCNAAVNPAYGPMAEIDDGAWEKTLQVNVTNVLKLCNLVLPGMAERRDGSVVLISSVGGLKGSVNLGAYAISKAADMQLARNLAVEWGPHNIRANAIAPGLVKTDFARALWEDPEARARAEAAYRGAKQVWVAVLVSALTTVMVFIPILVMDLEAGQLFRDIAVALSVSVLISLLVAVTLIPALANRILGSPGEDSLVRRRVPVVDDFAALFMRSITGLTHWVTQSRLRSVAVVAVLCTVPVPTSSGGA